MNSIGPSYRRIAAIGLLLGLIYLAFLFLAAPVFNQFASRDDQINELALQTTTLETIRARLQSTSSILASEVRRGDGKGLLLTAQSSDLASANLQSRLRSMVTTSGATLRSIRSRPAASAPGKAIGISARLSIIGDLASIQQTVHRIETAVPHLFVDQITVKPSRRQGEGLQISLDVDIALTAYLIEDAS